MCITFINLCKDVDNVDITLKNEKITAVVTTHGAELIALYDEMGQSYIWNGNPEYWQGRNPVLFPIVGNLKNGKIQMGGQDFYMNRHGFARDQEFKVVEQGDNYVVFELKSNKDTYKLYPRHFVFRVKHVLEVDGFTTTFYVENTDNKMMPFCVGAHTGFNCPLNDGETLEDYEIVFDEEETVHNILLSKRGCVIGPSEVLMLDHERVMPLRYEMFAKLDTVIFKNLKSTGVCLKHRETGRGIRMDFGDFPMMAFWTKGMEKAPFICVEPWHGCAALEDETGIFEDKEDCIYLENGQSVELSYTVRIL